MGLVRWKRWDENEAYYQRDDDNGFKILTHRDNAVQCVYDLEACDSGLEYEDKGDDSRGARLRSGMCEVEMTRKFGKQTGIRGSVIEVWVAEEGNEVMLIAHKGSSKGRKLK